MKTRISIKGSQSISKERCAVVQVMVTYQRIKNHASLFYLEVVFLALY